MVGVKLTLGLFVALAVAGVALPGNNQWHDGDGVANYGAGNQGGNNGNWGGAGGSASGFGSGSQAGDGGSGDQGDKWRDSDHGGLHNDKDGKKGAHNDGGSGARPPSGVHRRQKPNSPGDNGALGGGTQKGNDGKSNTGGDKSWDHGGSDENQPTDRGDQGGHGGKDGGHGGTGEKGAHLGPRGNGAWGADNEHGNDRMPSTGANGGKAEHGGNQEGWTGDHGDQDGKGEKGGSGSGETRGGLGPRGNGGWGGGKHDDGDEISGNGAGGGGSWKHTGNNQDWFEDDQGHGGDRGTVDKPGGGIRARDEEVDAPRETLPSKARVAARHHEDEQNDVPKPDNGPTEVDLNDFNRRWARALEDDDAPDVRFHFDSDHPHAQVNTFHARDTGLGMYECMYELFGIPCKYTPAVNDQCYNR